MGLAWLPGLPEVVVLAASEQRKHDLSWGSSAKWQRSAMLILEGIVSCCSQFAEELCLIFAGVSSLSDDVALADNENF